MSQRPGWWHTLEEARRQACVAIDFYNRSSDKRSFTDFVVHMHLAWQNLLHADFEKRKVNIYFREKNGRYRRDKAGQKVSWDLTTCLKKSFKDNDPQRANVEFFVGLRNSVEHRFQDSVLVATAAQAHALVINFEQELVKKFGEEHSLGGELRFPVFVQSLTPEGMEDQRKLRKALPATTRTYITEFEAALPKEVMQDPRYEYRVQLIPVRGPKTDADLAITFANINALTEDQIKDLAAGNKTATVILMDKPRSVGLLEELLPAAAVQEIAARIPFVFKISDFTKLRWKHGVGPAQGVKNKDCGDGVFCIFSKPHGNHLYTRAYVARCVGELATRENFIGLFGKEPVLCPVASDAVPPPVSLTLPANSGITTG